MYSDNHGTAHRTRLGATDVHLKDDLYIVNRKFNMGASCGIVHVDPWKRQCWTRKRNPRVAKRSKAALRSPVITQRLSRALP